MELRVGSKYRLGRKIGSGSFGDIYLGKTYYLREIGYWCRFQVWCPDVLKWNLPGANITSGEEVAIKLESVKTKHPQLHIESKFYKMMQGGGENRFPSIVIFNAVNGLLDMALQSPFNRSGYSLDQMVWRWRGLQCHGDGAPGSKLGRSVQLLLKEIHT